MGEELEEVATSKWQEAANNAAAHLNGLGNIIDPPIFCDEEVGPHNSNCNVILYENQLKSVPHWPHAQPLISPRGRRHEPLGEKPGKPSSRPSFHQIVTDTSLGSRVVDNLINFVFPEPSNSLYRKVNGKKLEEADPSCHEEVKGKSFMNWMDPKLQLFVTFLKAQTQAKHLLPRHTSQRTKLTWRSFAPVKRTKRARTRRITRAMPETARTIL